MRIIVVRYNENPVLRNIPHSLTIFQQIVGGRIEVVEPFPDDVILVCDESGRNNGKPINRVIDDSMDICGDFFLCGHDGEGLSDFPEDLVEWYMARFKLPSLVH